MTPDAAADIAREALIWLASRPEALGRFMVETGADPASIRLFAAEPAALGFVLDFLLGNEAILRDFAADAGLDPGALGRARAALPGGALPNWT